MFHKFLRLKQKIISFTGIQLIPTQCQRTVFLRKTNKTWDHVSWVRQPFYCSTFQTRRPCIRGKKTKQDRTNWDAVLQKPISLNNWKKSHTTPSSTESCENVEKQMQKLQKAQGQIQLCKSRQNIGLLRFVYDLIRLAWQSKFLPASTEKEKIIRHFGSRSTSAFSCHFPLFTKE